MRPVATPVTGSGRWGAATPTTTRRGAAARGPSRGTARGGPADGGGEGGVGARGAGAVAAGGRRLRRGRQAVAGLHAVPRLPGAGTAAVERLGRVSEGLLGGFGAGRETNGGRQFIVLQGHRAQDRSPDLCPHRRQGGRSCPGAKARRA